MKRFTILVLALSLAIFASPALAQISDQEVIAVSIQVDEFVILEVADNAYLIQPVLPPDSNWYDYPPVEITGVFSVGNSATVNIYSEVDREPTDDATSNVIPIAGNFSFEMLGGFANSPVALTLSPNLYTSFIGSQSVEGSFQLNMRSLPFEPGVYTCNLVISAIVE